MFPNMRREHGAKLIMIMKVTGKGTACIPEGPTKVLDYLNKVCFIKKGKKIHDWTYRQLQNAAF